MVYHLKDLIQFSKDAGRVIANLEAAYTQWLEAQQAYQELPVTMFWQNKNGTDYLAYKEIAGQGLAQKRLKRKFKSSHPPRPS